MSQTSNRPSNLQTLSDSVWDDNLKIAHWKTKVPLDGFVDVFMDLLFYINTYTSGTPITVEWNKNLPCYDSTCDTQVLKAFTDLPKDLPFVYGSLTAARTSFRPWLGPKNTSAFHVPGMEFFATAGEYKNETEWRNPAGWIRQIIPKGDQLPKFLDAIEKICNDVHKDLPAESIIEEDDSLDGRITLSHKGVHFAGMQYGFSGGHGVWEDELDLKRSLLSLSSPLSLSLSQTHRSSRITLIQTFVRICRMGP